MSLVSFVSEADDNPVDNPGIDNATANAANVDKHILFHNIVIPCCVVLFEIQYKVYLNVFSTSSLN